MDLLTQTVLGAAVGEVVLGKKAGNKAIAWGAVGGLIPDLDVLTRPFFSVVDGLFIHRGFSHSLIFAFLLAPMVGLLAYWIHRNKMDVAKFEWIKLIFWAAFTHPLLDYFTTYGTGAFLPFSGYRVEFSTIGIVDVFYTLPLLIVVLLILFLNRVSRVRRKLILAVVFLTSAYLLATVGNKIYINNIFEKAFAEKGIEYKRYKTIPLPLSNFLWMGIAEQEQGYQMALYSNFDNEIPRHFDFVPRNKALLGDFFNNEKVEKLLRFTKGYYHVNSDENGLYVTDLRFGKSGIGENAEYIFKFYIMEENGKVEIAQSTESRKIEANAFSGFIERVKGI